MIAPPPAASADPASPGEIPAPHGSLGRGSRLQYKRDFDRVFQRGRRAHGHHIHLIASPPREQDAPPRLGLAVAKGVGHAPARARLRRLTREAFRVLRPALRRPVDLVVSARLPWPNAQLVDVLEEMMLLGKKLRLID